MKDLKDSYKDCKSIWDFRGLGFNMSPRILLCCENISIFFSPFNEICTWLTIG